MKFPRADKKRGTVHSPCDESGSDNNKCFGSSSITCNKQKLSSNCNVARYNMILLRTGNTNDYGPMAWQIIAVRENHS
jgi:hypothetical protein